MNKNLLIYIILISFMMAERGDLIEIEIMSTRDLNNENQITNIMGYEKMVI